MAASPRDVSPDFSTLRIEYRQRSLREEQVDPDPIRQFIAWLNEAIDAGANEPNAMALATSTADGCPSARMVLLKEVNASGFAFFTNYASRKGRELNENPRAAIVFHWPELERQVRIEGIVQKTSSAESDAYFSSRPIASQFGSAASPQSQPIASREIMEARLAELQARFGQNGPLPRPEHWGGYRLKPSRIEFWQGRPNRVHDRIEYLLDAATQRWTIQRLAP